MAQFCGSSAHASRRRLHQRIRGVQHPAKPVHLFQLTALEDPSSAEVEAIELLTLLVERYEQTHYAIPEADAVSVVRFLIEQQGLTQRDLTPEFGSESAVSMFLAGQRKLTLGQVRKLSSRFKLPADVFIRRP